MRAVLGRLAACLTVVGAGVAIPLASAAVAEPDECSDPTADWCLEDDSPSSPTPGEEPSNGDGSSDEPPCGWVTIPASVVPPETSSRPYILTNGRPPEGLEVVWQGWCYRANGTSPQFFRGPFRWYEAGAPAPGATLEDVAAAAYDRLRGRLPEPVVVTSPAAGVDAVVDVPVFISVTNWQAELVENGDLLGDPVTVTATPTLLLSSGEPGSPPVTCEGPGRPYDPTFGDLWEQAAAPGACSFTYRQRTGAEGRPDAWPSVVTVQWSITWESGSGPSGSFPVVAQPVPLPRSVDEVRSMVVSGGG